MAVSVCSMYEENTPPSKQLIAINEWPVVGGSFFLDDGVEIEDQ